MYLLDTDTLSALHKDDPRVVARVARADAKIATTIISPHWFYLDYLSVVFEEVAKERYPIVYKFDSGAPKIELMAHSIEELISGVDDLASAAERELVAETNERSHKS